MEVLAPIIIDSLIKLIRERCKERNSKAMIRGMMRGEHGQDIPKRFVRRATRDATRDVYGRRHWKTNKESLLAAAYLEMAKESRQDEVMVGVFKG